jgi:hypothetical protein
MFSIPEANRYAAGFINPRLAVAIGLSAHPGCLAPKAKFTSGLG